MANPNPSPETRIRPGQVLNPGGHTKHSIRKALQDELGADADESDGLGKLARLAGKKLAQAGMDGDEKTANALCRVIEQAEGPQRQQIEHSGELKTRIVIRGFDDEGAA